MATIENEGMMGLLFSHRQVTSLYVRKQECNSLDESKLFIDHDTFREQSQRDEIAPVSLSSKRLGYVHTTQLVDTDHAKSSQDLYVGV